MYYCKEGYKLIWRSNGRVINAHLDDNQAKLVFAKLINKYGWNGDSIINCPFCLIPKGWIRRKDGGLPL